jgi:hypothetical protein
MGTTPHPNWARALERVSGQDMQAMLGKLVAERVEWPPTDLVGVMSLIDDAMHARHGLPTEAEALAQGRASDWRCPAVYEAAVRVGLWRVTGGPMTAKDESARFLKTDWPREWGKVCREVLAEPTVFTGPKKAKADPYAVALPAAVKLGKSAKQAMRERHGVDNLRARLGLKRLGTGEGKQ